MLFRKQKTVPDQPPMRAIEIARGDGGRGMLYPSQVPMPQPGPGEVLIQVAYAGVNRADLLQVEGSYLPPDGASPLPGLEVSGHIIALGQGVRGWSEGEEVCALLSGGGYADFVTVPAEQIIVLPGRTTLKDAATLPEAAATAFMALRQEANLKTGERVLIHGGSSGVGLMLVQVARAWGAEVFATAGGPEKCKFVANLGATALDHHSAPYDVQLMQATKNQGVDVIIDILGGPKVGTHFKLLRKGGRMVSLAFMEGNMAEVKLASLLMKHLRWSGATLRNRTAEEKAEIMAGVKKHVWPHIATGAIRPVVDSVFPLVEAEKAHQRMQERLHCGKILLEVRA